MKNVIPVSITTVEETKTPDVWCLNTTTGDLQSDIILTVNTRNGQDMSIFVPMTFVALNLTDQISKDLLLDSPSFRRAVSQRGITLIARETAAMINDNNSARDELERIRRMGDTLSAITAGSEVSNNIARARAKSEGGIANEAKTGSDLIATRGTNNPVKSRSSAQSVPPGVSPKVFAILVDQGSNEKEMVNALKVIRYSLTAKDSAFIEQTGKELGFTMLERVAEKVREDLEDNE